jgi:hypothetical protein
VKFLEVLLEGTSDQPTVRVILEKRFGLKENRDFRLHPHQGKGTLSKNPHQAPNPRHRGLLDLLPATLKGYASFPQERCVLVLVDADEIPCEHLKNELVALHKKLKNRPACTLFRIAVEEIESWFIADPDAIKGAYPKSKLAILANYHPDTVVGAWELLAKTIGRKSSDCSRADKTEWASKIAPHLDLNDPKSPSLKAFITGIEKLLQQTAEGYTNN